MTVPRIYQSFEEFKREEIRKLDSLSTSIDDMLEEHFSEELDFGEKESQPQRRKRGRPRLRQY